MWKCLVDETGHRKIAEVQSITTKYPPKWEEV